MNLSDENIESHRKAVSITGTEIDEYKGFDVFRVGSKGNKEGVYWYFGSSGSDYYVLCQDERSDCILAGYLEESGVFYTVKPSTDDFLDWYEIKSYMTELVSEFSN